MYQIVNYYEENSQAINDFELASRFLWDDHVNYTRDAITSILAGLPDIEAVSQRLLQNQQHIGALISDYYSEQDVQTLVTLLQQHITIAVDVINGIEGSEELWKLNGDNIVTHMEKMNPWYWPRTVIEPMWTEHLETTVTQVLARRAQSWTEDIAAYDQNHKHMAKFSDIFANGVVYQNIQDFCFRG